MSHNDEKCYKCERPNHKCLFCGEDNINHKRSLFHNRLCEANFLFGYDSEQQTRSIKKFCDKLALDKVEQKKTEEAVKHHDKVAKELG